MSQPAAIEYLRLPPKARWRWEEGANVVVWSDGTTLAFRAELQLVLERLAPSGLPPFPALVFLLAAARGKTDLLDASESVPETNRNQLLLALRLRQQRELTAKLAALAALPPELLAKPAGKAVLAEAVFERSARRSPEESARIVEGLPYVWDEAVLNQARADAVPFDATRTASDLASGAGRFTPDSLLLRLRTGLDTLPAAAPSIAVPKEVRVRRLLDALQQDEATSRFARLVRDLTAAIRLPRVLTEPDETAGGASDIGNRGALDRLLLSELAHDDLTLATRIALNEALYLRREPPAHRPERALALLLDAGIRMWGVPRIMGTAAALSVVAHHQGNGAISAWRAKGRSLVPVDLLDKKALETHLEALETELNPVAALPRFISDVEEQGSADVVVVTHRDIVEDADFHAHLAQAHFERGFLLLVDRDGSIELHRLPWGTQRPLAEVRIDPAQLMSSGIRRAQPLVATAADDLPAIFRQQPFPLRMPVTGKIDHAIAVGEGGVCVTKDHRLFVWEKPSIGARQLATDLPAGKTVWLHRHSDGRVFLVKGRGGDGQVSVVVVAPDGSTVKRAQFAGPHVPPAAWFASGVLLVALHTRVVCVDALTGEIRGEAPIPADVRHLAGRYYTGANDVQFVSWDGSGIRWDPILSGAKVKVADVVTAFDREGIGAWIVSRDGKIYGPTGELWVDAKIPIQSAQVFDQGERVVLSDMRNNRWSIVAMASRRIETPAGDTGFRANRAPVCPFRTLQTRFSEIAGGGSEPLRLRTSKGLWLEIISTNGGQAFQLAEAAVQRNAGRRFEPVTSPSHLGCGLRRAEWPGRSRAWLDSRGWLHLRSHDATVPELSIALCYQSPLAFWCSDGAISGLAFYTGPDASTDHARVAESFRRFRESLC